MSRLIPRIQEGRGLLRRLPMPLQLAKEARFTMYELAVLQAVLHACSASKPS
jgi:hypothetical protein